MNQDEQTSSISIMNEGAHSEMPSENNEPNASGVLIKNNNGRKNASNVEQQCLQFIAYRESLSLLCNRTYFPLSMMRKLRGKEDDHSESLTIDSLKKDDTSSKKVVNTVKTNNSKNNSTSKKTSSKNVKDGSKKAAVSLVAKGSSYETVNYVIDGPCIVTLDNNIKILSSTWVVDDLSLTNEKEEAKDEMNSSERHTNEKHQLINSQSNVFICDNEDSRVTTLQFVKENLSKSIHQCSRFTVQNIEFCSFEIENATEITLQPLTMEKKIQHSNYEISGMKLLRFHSLYLKLNCIIYFSENEIYRVTSLISKSLKTKTAKSINNGIYRVVSATKISLIYDTDSTTGQQLSESMESNDTDSTLQTIAETDQHFYFESKSCKELLSLLKVANSFFHHIMHTSSTSSSAQTLFTFSTPYSILIHGPHNIGKTSTVKNIAKKLKYPLIYVNCNSLGGGLFGNEQAISSLANRMLETAQRRLTSTKNSNDLTIILFLDDLDKIQASLFSSLMSIQNEMEKSELMKTTIHQKKSTAVIHLIIIGSASSDCEFMKKMEMRGKFQREVKFELPSPKERTDFCKVMYGTTFTHLDFEKIGMSTTGYQFYDLIKVFSSLNADMKLYNNIHHEISTEYVLKRIIELNLTPSIKKLEHVDEGQENSHNEFISQVHNEEKEGSIMNSNSNEILNFDEKHWDKIGGLSHLKQKLRQAAEWPMKYPESFKRLGLQPPLGILLYGPPGTGKTTLIRTLALSTHSTFLYCNVAQVYSPYVGEAEKAIRDIMSKARIMNPSIVFFDEIDAIVGKREFTMGGADSVSSRVLSTLLNEMDGIEGTKNLLVVAATNRPDMIDSALMRPGRLEHLLYVPPPDVDAKKSIFEIHMKNLGERFLNAEGCEISREEMVRLLVENEEISGEMTGAEIEALCREACMSALREMEALKELKDCSSNQILLSWKNFCEARKRVQPFLSTTEGKRMLDNYAKFERSFEKNMK
ncbi:hypothetical protein C9374_000032 [Naegleria lovaniensis]|uniref:AAA+ ATPase domain-containing protein n=1 Tax=Naegleria lovaniensis TaxID=51637 RepID=A0AA88GY97_NAELO|nr:uncharacterized protein C9374_000032 [Naegleria lovaniensis]KAG2388593.1 hypothetical protein C9374_000032 [Naegleria lovaniensis]